MKVISPDLFNVRSNKIWSYVNISITKIITIDYLSLIPWFSSAPHRPPPLNFSWDLSRHKAGTPHLLRYLWFFCAFYSLRLSFTHKMSSILLFWSPEYFKFECFPMNFLRVVPLSSCFRTAFSYSMLIPFYFQTTTLRKLTTFPLFLFGIIFCTKGVLPLHFHILIVISSFIFVSFISHSLLFPLVLPFTLP